MKGMEISAHNHPMLSRLNTLYIRLPTQQHGDQTHVWSQADEFQCLVDLDQMTNFTPGTNALAVPLDGDKIKIVFMECICMYKMILKMLQVGTNT